MKILRFVLAAISAAFFIAGNASAQTSGTVANHAIAVGKGPGTTGLTSVACADKLFLSGRVGLDPECRAIVGADLPYPSVSSLGGVLSSAAVSNQFLTGLGTDGAFTRAQPSFSSLAGSIACAQLPALTGNVTSSAGSCATTIPAGVVTNSQLAVMAAGTFKGNVSGSTATPSDLTATQVTAALNVMVGDSGSGGVKGLAPAPGPNDAADGKYLKADGTWQIPPGSGGGGASASDDDYLINGDGQVNQTGASTGIADGSYGHDQWVALTQTGAIAVSTLTDVEDGLPNMIRLTQSQATAQRMGYIQPLEASRIKRLRGNLVTMVMRLRSSTGAAIRYAIVEHTGTADTLTKDIVNDWTSGTYTTGNFFASQSGNITVRAVGTITPSANTLTDATLSATLGSTLNNLYVFVWTEGTAAQNSTLDLAVNLRRGNASAPVVMRSLDQELFVSKRYWESSYNYGVAPGTITNVGALSKITQTGSSYHTLSTRVFVSKRATPTVSLYSTATGAVGKIAYVGVGDVAAVPANISQNSMTPYVNGVLVNTGEIACHFVADSRL